MKRYIFSFFSAIILLGLFVFTFYQLYRNIGVVNDSMIALHVQKLAKILKQIDGSCKIISFEHDKNYIDFLTVKSFVGSEVGSMNLAFPGKWAGPYLRDNFTIQEKYYCVYRTNSGYFILPDAGVVLANGKILGKDIVITPTTDVQRLINTEGVLRYKDTPLGAKITISDKKDFAPELAAMSCCGMAADASF